MSEIDTRMVRDESGRFIEGHENLCDRDETGKFLPKVIRNPDGTFAHGHENIGGRPEGSLHEYAA